MPPAATTLRGALLVFGQHDPQWLEKVDRKLGNVLTGTDSSRSMHGVFGWIHPNSTLPQIVRKARQIAIEMLSSVDFSRTRLDLVTAVHTTTVALAFFDEIRGVLATMPGMQIPSADEWHQEDHSFVSYLYSDDLPVPSAARTFEAHLADVTRWAADRGERVHRALHGANPDDGAALLDPEFAHETTARYAGAFSSSAALVPEFVVWADTSDADLTSRAVKWLSGKYYREPADGPLQQLRNANQAVLNQPLADELHLPTIDQLYVSPSFRTAEAGPSARLADDAWWSSEVPLRQNLDLMLAGHLNSPLATKAPMLLIGEAAAGKSTVARMLAAFPPAGDPAVVRVPLGRANPDVPVAEQVEHALRHLTSGGVTWDDLASHVSVVVLDGLDELLSPVPNTNYLSEVVRFQRQEASRDRPVAVVVTSRVAALSQVLIPDGVPVVRLEQFDETQTRAWVAQWNQATADTPRRPLPADTVLDHAVLARQPQLLFLTARYVTDPSVPEAAADLTTPALLQWLNDLRALRVGMETRQLGVAALGMFNRGRGWLSEHEFHADLTALGYEIPDSPVYPLRSGPLADYQIASTVLDLLIEADDDRLFTLLSQQPLATRPSISTMIADVVRLRSTQNPQWTTHAWETLVRISGRSGNEVYLANLTLLGVILKPGGGVAQPDDAGSGVEFVHRARIVGSKPIGQITWSADGQLLTVNSGRRIRFWKTADDTPPRETTSRADATDVAWHPTQPIAAIVRRRSYPDERGESPLNDHEVVLVGFTDGMNSSRLCVARGGSRVSWSPDGAVLALLDSYELRIIDVISGRRLRRHQFGGAPGQFGAYVPKPRWTRDGQHVVAVHRRTTHLLRRSDMTRIWRRRLRLEALEIFVSDETHAVGVFTAPDSSLIEIRDLVTDQAVVLLSEHSGPVVSAKFSPQRSFLATLSKDNTMKIWRCRDWQCVATVDREDVQRRGGLAFHPTKPLLAVKDGNKIDVVRLDHRVLDDIGPARTARRYTNAKVVLVGDTGVGKSGLGLVLSGKPFAPTESTHGRNVWTFEKTYATLPSSDVQTRETLLWDLAGQPGYRMVHQLHLNEVAVALVVFDARSETDPFAGVQYWSRALKQARRLDGANAVRMRVYLVAARADRGTAAVSRERILETTKAFGFDGYLETSAKEGWGVDDLVRAVRDGIDWDALPVVSSNELFETIKDFVIEEKQQGRILSTVDDLVHSFRRAQLDAPPVEELNERFAACLGRLESVGVVRRMSYGDYVLLRPELLDSYASSLVQAARDEPDGLGFVKEDDALEGNFRIPKDERLTNPQQERILLNAVVQELLRREIALKEVTDREVDLIFPSQFTRERPDAPQLPGQDVVFTFDGHLYSIYSTLAVRLSHSRFFEKDEMWHNSATYQADAGRCGIAIREVEEGKGELAVFYDEQVPPLVRKQFEAYVVEHLEQRAGEVVTRRVRACQGCGYTIPDDLVRGRISRGKHKMTCPQCDDFVIALVDEPDGVDVRPVVAEMNSNANAQRDQDVAATTLKGKREAGDYDVFLSHNVKDKPQVLKIAAALEDRGILPWLDVHDIQPGTRWQQEMAKGIERSRSAAVLIGPAGPGPWHEAEMELINEWSARNKSRKVIPVILDGTEDDPELPGFLRVWSTVDMRTADPDPIEQLVWGITGRHPRWD
ncbi:TIR domain-containing protein [Lentzea sp. NPDC006480]|uniref:NACHT N-terminal helical domain 7-containing protein n=1 Tax=Lentzea sp. NPDC006480 TaxID=3157176 RepID=UPI0033BD2380